MMGRLVVDDLVHWATTFKVDGFRFDCMVSTCDGGVGRGAED